jgi:predicted Zn finger-like uncharacterized protein
MPLVTTCPACNASFVVNPEQLSAHKGDVRCGKCKHVFNALNHLVSLPDENAEVLETPDFTKPSIQAYSEVEEAPAIDTTKEEATAETSVEASQQSPTVIPAFNAANFNLNSASGNYTDEATMDLLMNKKPWWVNVLWGLLALILLLGIALQAIYYLRTDIAAQKPQFKPYLEQACQQIGCEIELPKHVNLLVIDDSDLQEDAQYQGLIRLNTTLLNRAEFAQAFPKIELTLTDAQDKVLIRKSFKPEQYLTPDTPIAEGIPANDSVFIKLAVTANKLPVAGYRLFITY